jgi:cytidylate kinase
MKEQTREEPMIIAAAERQMQAWVLTAEIQGRAIRAEGPHRLSERLGRYVSISREAGAGGSQIAQLVGQQLGWEVLDKNLLDQVAERFRCSRSMLKLVDETESSWVYDVLGTWMDRQVVTHDKYVAHLGRVILAAARRGNVVLVGRGARFLLPREKGLAVRLIASKKYRVEQIVQREGLNQADAGRWVEVTDRGRREFVLRYFHQDIADPHLYDLVINVERLGPAATVQQIVTAISR